VKLSTVFGASSGNSSSRIAPWLVWSVASGMPESLDGPELLRERFDRAGRRLEPSRLEPLLDLPRELKRLALLIGVEHGVDDGEVPAVVDQLERDQVELSLRDVRIVRNGYADDDRAAVRQEGHLLDRLAA